MENVDINNHTELVMRIMHLKQEKFRQEEGIKYSFKEIPYLLNPATMAKKYIHELATDNKFKFDLARVGLNLATNLVITRILSRNQGFKGYLGALLIEKLSSSFIISGISRLMQRRLEREPTNQ